MTTNKYLNAVDGLAKDTSGSLDFSDCRLTDAHLLIIFTILSNKSQQHNCLSLYGQQNFSIPTLKKHFIDMLQSNPEAIYCCNLPKEVSLDPEVRRLWEMKIKGNPARILSPEPAVAEIVSTATAAATGSGGGSGGSLNYYSMHLTESHKDFIGQSKNNSEFTLLSLRQKTDEEIQKLAELHGHRALNGCLIAAAPLHTGLSSAEQRKILEAALLGNHEVVSAFIKQFELNVGNAVSEMNKQYGVASVTATKANSK